MDFTAAMFLVVPLLLDDVASRREILTEMTSAYVKAVRTGQIGESAFLAPLPLYMVEGRWDELVSAAETMIAAHIVSTRGMASVALAEVLRARGTFNEAVSAIEPYLPDDDVRPDQLVHQELWIPVMAQLLTAQIELDRGDHVTARRWLAAHDRWREWWQAIYGEVASRLTWAQLALLDGDRDLAEAHVRTALDRAQSPRQPLGLIAAHRMLGELLADAGRVDEAMAHLDESRRLAHACEAPYELAQTLVSLASVQRASGAADEAAECLAEARAICEPLGAAPLLQRIADLETGAP
jgi:tetratricopeptide (TPR) repeat protein